MECPHCGSDDVTIIDIIVPVERCMPVLDKCECQSCGTTWTEDPEDL